VTPWAFSLPEVGNDVLGDPVSSDGVLTPRVVRADPEGVTFLACVHWVRIESWSLPLTQPAAPAVATVVPIDQGATEAAWRYLHVRTAANARAHLGMRRRVSRSRTRQSVRYVRSAVRPGAQPAATSNSVRRLLTTWAQRTTSRPNRHRRRRSSGEYRILRLRSASARGDTSVP